MSDLNAEILNSKNADAIQDISISNIENTQTSNDKSQKQLKPLIDVIENSEIQLISFIENLFAIDKSFHIYDYKYQLLILIFNACNMKPNFETILSENETLIQLFSNKNRREEIIKTALDAFNQDKNCYFLTYSQKNSGRKGQKLFLNRYLSFWSLVTGILVDKIFAENGEKKSLNKENFEFIIDQIISLSNSDFRPLRLAATYTSFEMCNSLIWKAKQLQEDLKNNLKKQEKATKVSKNKNLKKVENKEIEISEKEENLKLVNCLLKDLFEKIFVHRFRDVFGEVRKLSIDFLGNWILNYPAYYLKDSKLKYIGQCLNDKESNVRSSCLRIIRELYQHKHVTKLADFIDRFLPRILEMVNDKDNGVVLETIDLLSVLLKENCLEENEGNEVSLLLLSNSKSIRDSAAKFMMLKHNFMDSKALLSDISQKQKFGIHKKSKNDKNDDSSSVDLNNEKNKRSILINDFLKLSTLIKNLKSSVQTFQSSSQDLSSNVDNNDKISDVSLTSMNLVSEQKTKTFNQQITNTVINSFYDKLACLKEFEIMKEILLAPKFKRKHRKKVFSATSEMNDLELDESQLENFVMIIVSIARLLSDFDLYKTVISSKKSHQIKSKEFLKYSKLFSEIFYDSLPKLMNIYGAEDNILTMLIEILAYIKFKKEDENINIGSGAVIVDDNDINMNDFEESSKQDKPTIPTSLIKLLDQLKQICLKHCLSSQFSNFENDFKIIGQENEIIESISKALMNILESYKSEEECLDTLENTPVHRIISEILFELGRNLNEEAQKDQFEETPKFSISQNHLAHILKLLKTLLVFATRFDNFARSSVLDFQTMFDKIKQIDEKLTVFVKSKTVGIMNNKKTGKNKIKTKHRKHKNKDSVNIDTEEISNLPNFEILEEIRKNYMQLCLLKLVWLFKKLKIKKSSEQRQKLCHYILAERKTILKVFSYNLEENGGICSSIESKIMAINCIHDIFAFSRLLTIYPSSSSSDSGDSNMSELDSKTLTSIRNCLENKILCNQKKDISQTFCNSTYKQGMCDVALSLFKLTLNSKDKSNYSEICSLLLAQYNKIDSRFDSIIKYFVGQMKLNNSDFELLNEIEFESLKMVYELKMNVKDDEYSTNCIKRVNDLSRQLASLHNFDKISRYAFVQKAISWALEDQPNRFDFLSSMLPQIRKSFIDKSRKEALLGQFMSCMQMFEIEQHKRDGDENQALLFDFEDQLRRLAGAVAVNSSNNLKYQQDEENEAINTGEDNENGKQSSNTKISKQSTVSSLFDGQLENIKETMEEDHKQLDEINKEQNFENSLSNMNTVLNDEYRESSEESVKENKSDCENIEPKKNARNKRNQKNIDFNQVKQIDEQINQNKKVKKRPFISKNSNNKEDNQSEKQMVKRRCRTKAKY